MKKYILSLFVVLVLPVIVLAQTVDSALGTIKGVVDSIIPIMIGVALIVFIWGIIKYVLSKDESAQKESRALMFWGIVGLFVIVGVWGLVGLLAQTFGITPGGTAPIPGV